MGATDMKLAKELAGKLTKSSAADQLFLAASLFIMDSFLACSAVMPFMDSQVPLATYFHSPLSSLTLDWPAHECVPARLAQSF